MEYFKALLDTEFVDEVFVRRKNEGWPLSQKEVDDFIKAAKLLNGQIAVLSESYVGDDYSIYGVENREVFKEFVYLCEQDEMFGQYIDDRKRFEKDWENEEYEPMGSLTVYKEFVKTIIETTEDD